MPDLSKKTEFDAAQLIQDFGDYYLNSGQNLDNLHLLPFESFETSNAFTIIPTNDTIVRESNVTLQKVLQQWQKKFTPNGGVDFEPIQTILGKMKIDQTIEPSDLVNTWVGFLTSNSLNEDEWPLIRWYLELLTKQSKEDMEMDAIYKGVLTNAVEGESGNPGEVMDGIEVIQNRLIAAGKIDPIVLGTPDEDDADFVTQVELFVQSIPEKFRYMPMELNMNRTLRDKFKRGTRAKYKMNYAPGDIKNYQVADAENITVVGRPSMQNKNRIWCTPKQNAVMYVKGFEYSSAFKMQAIIREVHIWSQWWAAINFINPRIVFVSDGEVE